MTPPRPAPTQAPTAAPRANLDGQDIGSVIAALAGMKGDKVDMSETIGALGAMLGDDEFARRGLIAQGQMPGKEFALTADRADQIAGNADAAENAPPSRTVARVRCGLSFRRRSALPYRQDHHPHDVAYDRQLKRPPTPCGQQD